MIDGIFLSLGLDKCEWLEREDNSLASFMSCVEECISERKFEEGLNNLATYKTFSKNVES